MPKVPYPYEVNGKLFTGNGSLIPIINPFLIAKFDCGLVTGFVTGLVTGLITGLVLGNLKL